MAKRLVDLYEQPLHEAPSHISGGLLMKGGIMLSGGPAKIGKTFLHLSMAHSLATATPLWGTGFHVLEPTPTLYVDGELGEYGFHERIKQYYDATGTKPPSNLYYITKDTKDLYIDTLRGQQVLNDEIEETGAKVVIIDPISRKMLGEENSNTAVQMVFTNLDGLIAEHADLSFILVHHFGKPPKGDYAEDYDPLDPYNFRGAAKWFDAPDTLAMFQRINPAQSDEWWRLRMGVRLRHAPEPDRMVLSIREGGQVGLVEDTRSARTGLASVKGTRWGKR